MKQGKTGWVSIDAGNHGIGESSGSREAVTEAGNIGEFSGTISSNSFKSLNATDDHGTEASASNTTGQSISKDVDVRSLEISNSTADQDIEESTESNQTDSNNLTEERQIQPKRTEQYKVDLTSGGTGTGSHSIDPQETQTEEWTVVDPHTNVEYLRQEMTKYCETPHCSDISLFLYLILNVLKEHESLNAIHDESMSFIAHMLELCDARLLDVDVLKSLQAMIDCVTSPYLLDQIYKHLVFNFRIWSSCYFGVRVGHIQYLSTIIKDNSSLFKKSFGVQFFLDVIRMYYAWGA